MAYQLTVPIILASSQVSLTLSAQLVDVSGANVGSPITAGFVEIGSGSYLWDTSAIPDGHRGGVKFFSGVTFKAFAAISPQDYENLDVKVSTLDGSDSTDPWLTELPGNYDPGTAGAILGVLTGAEVVTSTAPTITDAGDLELIKGQDYREENGNSITFSNSSTWPALGNATVWMEAFGDEPLEMSIVQLGATQIVRLNLDDQATIDLPLNRYRYSVFAQLSGGSTFVLASGRILFS